MTIPSVESFRTQITSVRNLLVSLPFVRNRQRLAYLGYCACFIFGILIPWMGMQFQGIPQATSPLAHARALAAETFARGEWANPPLVGGFFLQTYQVIQEPSYSAAIPPGPSLLLSIGFILSDPIFGLWLTSAFFSFATAWMIRAFTSLRWAIVGSLFVTLWFGALSYWSQSFEGSAAAACGIALAWGASKRFQSRGRHLDALLLGIGLGWTVLCDPLIACFALPIPAIMAALAWWKRRNIHSFAVFATGLLLCMSIQGLFNNAATGSITKSASAVYSERYDNNPVFFWQTPKLPPKFDFPRMEEYDLLVNEPGSMLMPPVGPLWLRRWADCLLFYAGPPALLAIVGALWLGLSRWAWWQLAGILTSLASAVIILPFNREIAAGLSCSVPLLLVWSLRRLCITRDKHGLDTWKLGGAFAFLVVATTLARGLDLEKNKDIEKHLKYQQEIKNHLLQDEGGRHVVIVQYINPVPIQVEYVYNSAVPESQDIVWARWNDKVEASVFFNHYKDRKMWLLAVTDDRLPELRPFQWITQDPNAAKGIVSQGEGQTSTTPDN